MVFIRKEQGKEMKSKYFTQQASKRNYNFKGRPALSVKLPHAVMIRSISQPMPQRPPVKR
ncbi:hypothetical protein CLOLEP_03734 [[Clostridium] leptum DSM 753]|uniref:Uncharacterized protein n=1 Tax=[Clostridium] leptum DSM 753 TaxID=428125 RepID=A7VYQ6_9FIRM|nr:hypothetical protein CLOLEP_03734 [[Clostridium] leptum DSM 753]